MKLLQYPGRLAACLIIITSALWCNALAQSLDAGVDPSDATYPVVITPTRLKQSLADVPASVTVITAETMRRYGITRIEEALRLVPGMAVSQSSGNDFTINYHGTNAISPRRLNVLIDGVSAYEPAFSRVQWTVLPVAMEDVDAIEVIRGPDSSSYGPNSMMAVVNILTRHPKDVERGLASISLGSHGMVDGTVRLATTVGATSLRATVNTLRNSGYDRLSLASGDHDSTRIKRLNLRAQHDLADGASLDLQFSHVSGTLELAYGDPFQTSYPDSDMRSTQLSGRWTKALSANHELQVDVFHARMASTQRWTSCWPSVAFLPELAALHQSNPDYVVQLIRGETPTGGTAQDDALLAQLQSRVSTMGLSAIAPNCGQGNQDGSESRTQIELQDTFVVSDTLRFVAGLGLRYQRADSQTFLGGAVDNSVHWAFGHAEYRPNRWLTANVGGYGEANSLSGGTFSPRLALNARVADNQTVRAVMSQGTRTPDLFEQRANWNYTFTDLARPVNGSTTGRLFMTARSPAGLSSERIWSRELGYLLTLRPRGLMLDARVFDDRLSHLISDRLTLPDFAPSNEGTVRLTGAEVQTSWELASDWSAQLSYGYLLNRGANKPREVSQYSRHSGSVGVSHAWSSRWRASLAFYGASADALHQRRYGRTDLTVLHALKLGALPASVSLSVSYLDNPAVNIYQDTTRFVTSSYNRQLSVHGQARVAF